ncbi:MAG TPA: hypothetical protein DCS66_09920 [Flavobacteriaceae bacterium]|nr:hypothetical protein [Flavobacteriaceae bacterium]HAT64904.1 hypothetical protein [Flavobacteriaceae bacterium]|tara:strand:+ start:1560 stop:2048 length:489 start_codon:yes stop_codon:yes gene_type:complete
MTINHKNNDFLIELSYAEWLKDYIKTGKYKNYNINSTSGIVELHKLNDITGKFEFNMLVDDHIGNEFVSREPVIFKVEPLSGIYTNENLIKRKSYINIQRKKGRYLLQIIPKIKAIKHSITTSTTSKWLGNFIFWVLVTVVGGICVLLIWSLFEGKIVSLFK